MDSHISPFFRGVSKVQLKITDIAKYKTSLAAGKERLMDFKYGLAIRLKL